MQGIFTRNQTQHVKAVALQDCRRACEDHEVALLPLLLRCEVVSVVVVEAYVDV